MARKNNKARHTGKYKRLNADRLIKELKREIIVSNNSESATNEPISSLGQATKKDRD